MKKDKKGSISKHDQIPSFIAGANKPYYLLALLSMLIYVQIFSFGLVQFDDHGFVLMGVERLQLSNIPEFFNHSVFWVLNDPTQEHDIYYRPLQNVFYALCQSLTPGDPLAFHGLGFILHVAVSFTLFYFLCELRINTTLAFILTSMYVVHPIHVQAVAWIAGVGDQLAALFSLLAIMYFKKFNDASEKGRTVLFGLLHLVFLAFALFSKEISIAVVPISLAIALFLKEKNLSHESALKRKSAHLLPMVMVWSGVVLVYFFSRAQAIPSTQSSLLGSMLESMKVNFPLLLEYFEKLFFPLRLSPIPSREDAKYLAGGVILVVLAVVSIKFQKNTRLYSFGLFWFLVFLLPSFIQQNTESHFFAFEHRLYLPMAGLLISASCFFNDRLFSKTFFKYASVVLIATLGLRSFLHARTFHDPDSFYATALASSPSSVIAWNGYGKYHLTQDKYEEAVSAFKQSHQFKPDDIQTTGKIGELLQKNLKRPKEAVIWFQRSLAIDSTSVQAAVSLAEVYYVQLHDTAKAISSYEYALGIDPKNEFAGASLGSIYVSLGQIEKARSYLDETLKSHPQNLQALKWMAISYYNEGRIDRAIPWLVKGHNINSSDFDFIQNLMICHYRMGNKNETLKYSQMLINSGLQIPNEIQAFLNN